MQRGRFIELTEITLSRFNLNAINSLHTSDDQQLLTLIVTGSEGAFTTLYHRYYEMLCRSAFKKLPDELIVEELVQDVFINFWNKATELDTQGNIKAYLFATLRNKVLHELRAGMVIARHAKIISQNSVEYEEDASEIMHTRQLEKTFNNLINDLPPQCREAFTLSRFENLSYKLIAERMNISVNTVEKHIGKALSILRKAFKEYDVTLIVFYFLLMKR